MFSTMLAPHPTTLLDAMLTDMIRCPSFATPAASSRPRLTERETDYILTLAAPGVKPDEVKLSASSEGELKMRVESAHANFSWSLHLPRDADLVSASASHVDGLLTIAVLKKQPEVTRIEFRTEDETTSTEEEKPRSYSITLNAAGIAQADLDLTVEDGVLKVRGATARTGARIGKHLRLPDDANAAGAHATHVDGILTVNIPKKAPPAEKTLEIKVNHESADEHAMKTAAIARGGEKPEEDGQKTGDAVMATAEEDDEVMV